MKMRAAVLHKMAQPPFVQSLPMTVEDVDLAPPQSGEVLIRIAAAGLCHSDLSSINGDRPRQLPMVLGHEAAGIIEECGPNTAGFAVGDHVVLAFVPSCGHCVPCMSGRPALCEPGAAANGAGLLISGGTRLSRNGQAIHHHIGVSAFAQYAVVSTNSIVKVDKSLPLDLGALFGCAVMTGVGAVVNTARVHPGSSVAVAGLGGVGLNAIMGAKLSGAATIIAVDLQEDKLALARELGATDSVNATDPRCVEAVREISKGGVEFAFEMAGSVKAMDLCYRITRRGGMTVTAGLPNPAHDFAFKQVTMVAEERCIRGSYVGSCVPLRDIPRFIELYQRGLLPIDRLMSGEIALDQINEGFDRLSSGHAIRQILRP